MAAFAGEYEVAAVDMRGYNLSDKPRGLANYTLARLVGDVVGLVGALGRQRATLVGHDWGGAVAWAAAAAAPHAWDGMAALAIPHPLCFEANMNWAQAKKSWYILFFQAPWLAEWMLTHDDCAAVGASVTDGGAALPLAEGEPYRQAFGRPGAATAAVNYYRAAVTGAGWRDAGDVAVRRSLRRPIEVPVLMLYAKNDAYLGPELVDGTDKYVRDLEIQMIESSHWVQTEAAAEVNAALAGFFKRIG